MESISSSDCGGKTKLISWEYYNNKYKQSTKSGSLNACSLNLYCTAHTERWEKRLHKIKCVYVYQASQQNDVISIKTMLSWNASLITFHTDPLNGYLLYNTKLDSFFFCEVMRQIDKYFSKLISIIKLNEDFSSGQHSFVEWFDKKMCYCCVHHWHTCLITRIYV